VEDVSDIGLKHFAAIAVIWVKGVRGRQEISAENKRARLQQEGGRHYGAGFQKPTT